MSKKISDLSPVVIQPTDMIPVARDLGGGVKQNFRVEASSILSNRKFCHLTSNVDIQIPPRAESPTTTLLALNQVLRDENSWYNTTSHVFAPGETGTYRLSGDFLFFIQNQGLDTTTKAVFNIGTTGYNSSRRVYFDVNRSPVGGHGTSACYKFIFSEIIDIVYAGAYMSFYITNETDHTLTVRSGTSQYNTWSLLIEKIY